MSIVLYALGAGLLAWGGYLMVAGESYAAIDIAASVAGWGAFTIGLGAIVAALNRLTKAVAASRGEASAPAKAKARSREAASAAKPEDDGVLPVFVPAASAAPAHFEPSEPKPIAVFKSAPAIAAESEPARAPGGSPERDATRAEPGGRGLRIGMRRSAARTDEPAVQTPPVAAARLGGGLTARKKAQPERTDPPALVPDAAPAADARDPVPPPAAEAGTPERPKAPRLIMPSRAAPIVTLDPAELAPPPETSDEKPVPEEAAAPAAPAEPPTSHAVEPTAGDAPADPAPPAHDEPAQDPLETEPTPPEPEPAVETTADPSDVARTPEQGDEVEVRPETREAVEPASTTPEPVPSSDPKVPDWLARARARRQARMRDADAPRDDVEQPRFVSEPPPPAEPSPESDPHLSAPDQSEPEPAPEPAPEPEIASGRQLVSEGEHNGVMYRFFDDGSVEAQSPHGVRRFASVDELRKAVAGARGPDYREPDPDTAGPSAEADPLDAALAELEGRPAPELRLDPDDRIGAGRR